MTPECGVCQNATMNTYARLNNLNRIRRISRLMDTAIRIPGTGFRIGLDPILGLVPGAGDLIATAVSGYILYLAARYRLPGHVFRRMVFNIALEAVVGTVPLIGDIFDAYYKSNIRNVALLEQYLQTEDAALQAEDALNLASVTPRLG